MKVTVSLDMTARPILRYIHSFKDKMTHLKSAISNDGVLPFSVFTFSLVGMYYVMIRRW